MGKEFRLRTIKDCPEGRDCPYTVIYTDHGWPCGVSARMDWDSAIKCCKLRRQIDGMRRIQDEQSQAIG